MRHSMKGAVGNLGARKAFEYARQLEMMGKKGDLSNAEELVNQLERELKKISEKFLDERLEKFKENTAV